MSDLGCRVEETSNLKNAGKTDKKRGFEIRKGSGPTPVTRSGSGATAPPLAARPTLTPCYRRAFGFWAGICHRRGRKRFFFFVQNIILFFFNHFFFLVRGVHKGYFHISAGMVARGGEGSPYANRCYICHREAFFPRQRGCDTPDTVYHQTGGLAGEEVTDCAGLGEAEGWCLKR